MNSSLLGFFLILAFGTYSFSWHFICEGQGVSLLFSDANAFRHARLQLRFKDIDIDVDSHQLMVLKKCSENFVVQVKPDGKKYKQVAIKLYRPLRAQANHAVEFQSILMLHRHSDQKNMVEEIMLRCMGEN